MKRFGIWLVLLVIVLALVSTPLASRLVLIRSSWQKKTDDGKKKVVELRENADKAEKAVVAAKKELQDAIFGWEKYWATAQVAEGRQPGTLATVGLGTNQGFAPVGALVYAFQPSGDGQGMTFVGAFKISATQETQAALTPNWRLRPDDSKTWRYGPNWRFRSSIPLAHKTQFSDYEKNHVLKDELLAAQQLNLVYQQNAKAKAEEHLALRMKELNGDPDQANKSLDKYLIEGYHKTVADLETGRNAVQSDVDELRRLVKRARDEINRLTQENKRLAEAGSSDVPRTATNKKQ